MQDEREQRERVAKIIGGLAALYPRQEIGHETVAAYVRMLVDLDPTALERAATICSAESPWFPSVSELRQAAVEDTLAAPPAVPAWERVVSRVYGETDVELSDLERRALRFVGGEHAVKTSERPEWLRQQFLKAYDELRRDEVRVRSLAGLGVTRRDALPGPRREVEAAEEALAALDETTSSWDEEIAKVTDPKLRGIIEGARAAAPRPHPAPDALS